MEPLTLFILTLLVGLGLWIVTRLVIVRPGYVVVTRNMITGAFGRVLKEGFHVVSPLEYSAGYSWTFPTQDFGVARFEGTALRVEGDEHIDMVPFECETADGAVVSVDTLLVWRVENPQAAMTHAHDPLNLLCQQIIAQLTEQVNSLKRANLARNRRDIAAKACTAIARDWTPTYGLRVVSCEIQAISHDEETLARRRKMRDGMTPQDLAKIERARALGQRTTAQTTVVRLSDEDE